ncbi:hypothetical protein K435DRAFT_858709 [Dendrothele bispora CBS 962.96]|uniref:Uncharacterized protein n=1 Tax=Dendrothele bispora (strain CBS 962.96) TaxID=1314807 RepID=A0A4S8M2I1_DENBC|nr:hypothetical protein K435DRAFT_858709 [Dendrothele bispora CBS 962.96]
MSLSDDSQQACSDFIALVLPLTFSALLYGAYLVLFMFCMYIIIHRRGCVKKLQIIAIVALFILATLGFIFSCIFTNLGIKGEIKLAGISSIIVFGLFILANIIADIILVHRCFKIWGFKKKVIALPVFITIISNGQYLCCLYGVTAENSRLEGLALAQLILMAPFMGDFIHFAEPLRSLDLPNITSVSTLLYLLVVTIFLTNLLIPLMIGNCQSFFAITKFDDSPSAGRIWWIGGQVSEFLPSRFNLGRHSIVVCLESGIMYPLALVPTMVLPFTQSNVFFLPILVQVLGIAPTFIIVRVALGISIESVQGTIRMNERNGHGDQVLSLCEGSCNIDEYILDQQSTV